MRKQLITKRSVLIWRFTPVLLLLVLLLVWASAEMPATKHSTTMPGTPEEAVALLLEADSSGQRRNEGNVPSVLSNLIDRTNDNIRLFGACAPSLMRNYKIVSGGYEPTHEGMPAGSRQTYFVTVEAEVLAVPMSITRSIHKEKGYCGWKDLKIINPRTGKPSDVIGDLIINEQGHLNRSFGSIERMTVPIVGYMDNYYYIIHPDHRRWRFRIPMVHRDVSHSGGAAMKDRASPEEASHRGWMFVWPYPMPLVSATAEMRAATEFSKSENYKKTKQMFEDCQGRGKLLTLAERATTCSLVQMDHYRLVLDLPAVRLKFYRDLLNNEQPTSVIGYEASYPHVVPAIPANIKPGTPEAAVAVLFEVDITGTSRGSNHAIPVLFPFIADPRDKSIYVGDEEMFANRCRTLIRNYRIVDGGYVPLTEGSPTDTPRTYHVMVEAEVLAVWGGRPVPIPPKKNGYCGWKNVEIIDRATGQSERIGDVLKDDGGNFNYSFVRISRRLDSAIPLFGTYFEVIKPRYRYWRFRIPLVYREFMRFQFVQEHGQHRDVLHRGWMFVDPYPSSHTDINAAINEVIRETESDYYKKRVQLLADCEGRGNRLSPEAKQEHCTPEKMADYRDTLQTSNTRLSILRSLLSESTSEGAP